MVVLLLSTRCVFLFPSVVILCLLVCGMFGVFESACATIIASVIVQVLPRRSVEEQVLSRKSKAAFVFA